MVTKKKINKLESVIKRTNKLIEKLANSEKRVRENWTRKYLLFLNAAKTIGRLKIRGTKREARLQARIDAWEDLTKTLTAERDRLRAEIEKEKEALIHYQTELSIILEKEKLRTEEDNKIVNQIFVLNKAVVEATNIKNDFLTTHIFPRLFDQNGNLRTQVTIDNADGTKRVIALVNTIQIVKVDLAEQAQAEIQKFFDRIMPEKARMDDVTGNLYDLTKKILVEKTNFKIGSDFYRFLSMDFDPDVFPELKIAQDLLKLSLRSEKTNSYIRLYTRNSPTDKWQPHKQS